MNGKNYNKFIKYFNLNEISKFSKFNNIFLLTGVKSVSIGLNLDFSKEKSKLFYYSKGLLGFFLIYLITNQYPEVKVSKDQSILSIKSNLVSRLLISFLEKFFIIYNSKKINDLFSKSNLNKGFIRFIITDLNVFSDLDGFLYLFRSIEFVYIDILFFHEDDIRNFIFLDNNFKSSFLV